MSNLILILGDQLTGPLCRENIKNLSDKKLVRGSE
jgi:hypothetical protein